jgi:predicted GIY-YIG superfamily endonuclease
MVYLARYVVGRKTKHYTGYTAIGSTRLEDHVAGNGARCLVGKRIIAFAAIRGFATRSEAMRFEATTKKLTPKQKSSLFDGGIRIHIGDLGNHWIRVKEQLEQRGTS